MRAFILQILAVIATANFGFTTPAQAQTLPDLQKLSEVVWRISHMPSDNEAAFEQIVQEVFPSVDFENPQSFLERGGAYFPEGMPMPPPATSPQLGREWDDIARIHSAYISDYSALDKITCVVMTEAGVGRLDQLRLEDDHDAISVLPLDVRKFPTSLFAEAFENGALTAQTCIAVFNPKDDRVDYAAWLDWYDLLEAQFLAAGLSVERSSARPPAYLAGFLSARGSVCEDRSCILTAVPFSAALPSLNTNQTTISVMSVLYP